MMPQRAYLTNQYLPSLTRHAVAARIKWSTADV